MRRRRIVQSVRLVLAAVWALASCGRDDAGSVRADISRARLVESFVQLNVGDSAFQFRAVAERNSGRLDTISVPALIVEDSTVARLVDGKALPLDVGQTSVRIEIAPSLRLRGIVHVSERVFSDSVWLSPGQVRAWELKPGWHRITVDAKAPRGEPQPLELAADLICVPDSRGPKETIVCNVRRNTRILLRHTSVGRVPTRAVAVVTILRTPR